MNILVSGGAGYIGSGMTRQLLNVGHTVNVYDNLSTGHADSVDPRAVLVKGDLSDQNKLAAELRNHHTDAVMHFAGVISMAESMENPGKYFQINTGNSRNLLEAMREEHVGFIIFSSTAGVYGDPEKLPIPEDHPYRPTNPYGESKLMVEQILAWYDRIFDMKYLSPACPGARRARAPQETPQKTPPKKTSSPPAGYQISPGQYSVDPFR